MRRRYEAGYKTPSLLASPLDSTKMAEDAERKTLENILTIYGDIDY